jgi:hypothetical protein
VPDVQRAGNILVPYELEMPENGRRCRERTDPQRVEEIRHEASGQQRWHGCFDARAFVRSAWPPQAADEYRQVADCECGEGDEEDGTGVEVSHGRQP